MKESTRVKKLMLFCLLATGLAGCKTVETRNNWDAFNKEIPITQKAPDKLRYFDTPECYFFRMNVYWRRVEITPEKGQDFTYRWFTTYDHDPNLSSDSLIQNVVLYLFQDGRALLRAVVHPEPGTKRPGKFKWSKTYDISDSLLFASKQYVAKNKIKFGRYRVVQEMSSHKPYNIKIDLYAAMRRKKLKLFRKNGDEPSYKERDSRISLYVDLFGSRTTERPTPTDSLKTTIASFVRKGSVNTPQQSRQPKDLVKPDETRPENNAEEKRNAARLAEPQMVNDSDRKSVV